MFSDAIYSKCIKDMILYCAGKINSLKAWVPGSRYSLHKILWKNFDQL